MLVAEVEDEEEEERLHEADRISAIRPRGRAIGREVALPWAKLGPEGPELAETRSGRVVGRRDHTG